MGGTMTCGRYPSLREVLEYYSREDFLDFVLRTCEVRRVLLVIPKRKHWEPDPERDLVTVGNRAALLVLVRGRILSEHAGAPEDARLPFYPSFHQSLERWSPGQTDAGDVVGRDSVLEADLPSWRSSFQDVMTLVDVLDEEGIPYLLKFSGQRSLHVVVPYGGKGPRADIFGESRAHPTKILRMPYSLNEDTGLVSLPLKREDLTTFRPWQANLHCTRIGDDWLAEPTPEERKRVIAFVAASKEREPVLRRRWPEPVERLSELRGRAARVCGRVASEMPAAPTGNVRRQLAGDEPTTGESLEKALAGENADTRWLTTEAFLLHGNQLPRGAIDRLVMDEDDYVRAAAVDVLSRFADVTQSYFVEKMQAEEMGRQAALLRVLAQSMVLRDRVVAGLRAESTRPGPLVMRLACVTGAVLDDWPGAWELVQTAEEQGTTGPNWQARVQALRLMERATERGWGYGPDREIVDAIAAIGPVVIDLLLLAVGSESRRRRRTFLMPLCLLADERAMEVYVEALGDNFRDNARWATRALTGLGPKAVPPLLEAAASDEARLRRYAIRCLGHIADPRARDTVLGALEDPDESVCRQAVIAARHYAEGDHIPLLADVMRRERPDTRSEARELLLSLGDAGRKALRELALENGEPAAAGWLWRQGDARGREAVLAAARSEGHARETAVIELAGMPLDDETIEVLCEALGHYRWRTQHVIADALARAENPKALAALIELSRSGDVVGSKAAAEALKRWDDPRAVTAVVSMLADPHRKVRSAATAALVDLGEPAREALEETRVEAKSAHVQEQVNSVLNALDVRRRLAEGEALGPAFIQLIAGSHIAVWDEVAEYVREGGTDEDISALLQVCARASIGVAWCAAAILGKVGERVRGPVEELLNETADGQTRRKLHWVLELLDKTSDA